MIASEFAGGAGPLVVDTHTAVWFLHEDQRLSQRARDHIRAALANGHAVYVPSIRPVELVYLVEKGRIPEEVVDRVGKVLAVPEFGSGSPSLIGRLPGQRGGSQEVKCQVSLIASSRRRRSLSICLWSLVTSRLGVPPFRRFGERCTSRWAGTRDTAAGSV